jgi:hypothetical protein
MPRKSRKTSKYKSKQFASETAFYKWVIEEASKACLTFVDNEFSVRRFFVDKDGEILDSNISQKYWKGKFVNMQLLEIGWAIEIWNNEKGEYEIHKPLVLKNKVLNN